MIGMVFHYETVVAEIAPIYDQLLDRVCYNGKHFGATHILLIDGSSNHALDKWKKGYGDSEIEIEIFDSLDGIEEKYKDKVEFVYLENKKTLDKYGFKYFDLREPWKLDHVIFVSGQNYSNIEGWMENRKDNFWATLPIEDMFSDTACLIALYERNR